MKHAGQGKIPEYRELSSRIDDGRIYVTVVCPRSSSCNDKEEMHCKYATGTEKCFEESKFPIDDSHITHLGCNNKFTLGRNKKGAVYIESGDTKNVNI